MVFVSFALLVSSEPAPTVQGGGGETRLRPCPITARYRVTSPTQYTWHSEWPINGLVRYMHIALDIVS